MEAIRRKLLFQALALKNYALKDLLQDAKYLEDHLIQPFQKTYRPFVNGFKVFTPILLFVPQFLFVSESYETKCLLLKVSLGGLLLLVSLVVMIMPYIHMYYSDVRQRDLLIAQWLTEWVDEQQRAA